MWEEVTRWALAAIVFAAMLATVFVVGRWKSGRQIGFGFCTTGLALGLLLGLSRSPVLAGLVAGGFAIAGQLVTQFAKLRSKADSAVPNQLEGVTTNAIPWILPLSVFLLGGILLGIFLRANNLLSVHPRSLRVSLSELGFSDVQVESMMQRYSEELTPESVVTAVEEGRNTYVLSSNSTANSSNDEGLWNFIDGLPSPPSEKQIVKLFLDQSKDPTTTNAIMTMQKNHATDAEIVDMLRNRRN